MTLIAKYMGPIWVKSGPIWAGTWVPYGQPIWVSFGAHGPHLAQMGSMLRLHRTDHAGTIMGQVGFTWATSGPFDIIPTYFPYNPSRAHKEPRSRYHMGPRWVMWEYGIDITCLRWPSEFHMGYIWAPSGHVGSMWVTCGLWRICGPYVAQIK